MACPLLTQSGHLPPAAMGANLRWQNGHRDTPLPFTKQAIVAAPHNPQLPPIVLSHRLN